MDLSRMRREYEARGLGESNAAPDPLDQFDRWLREAVEVELVEPNAMVVSTVDADNRPHSRHLLLKGVSDGGFEFYTNYQSHKGRDLAANPAAALTFAWLALHRQVNVVGTVEQLTASESDAYFAVRPRPSQLGAWASEQSVTIADRQVLDDRMADLEKRFPDEVPRPPHWGGYRLRPSEIEFWQGRPNRLHDRLRYTVAADGHWTRRRLSP